MSDVLKVYPQLKLRIFVTDTNIHTLRNDREAPQSVPKTVSKFKSVVKRQSWKLSLTEGGKGGNSKVIATQKQMVQQTTWSISW